MKIQNLKQLINKIIKEEIIRRKKLINEISFFDVINDDILSDKYLTDFIKTDDAAANLLDYYIDDNNLDDEDENDVIQSDDFREFIKDELSKNLEEAKENIYHNIDYENGKIKLYRAMTVDDNWLEHLKKQGKRLGIYWSWDEHGAIAHWAGSQKNTAIIESDIDEKYVNWTETLIQNMHPNYSVEEEIRLFKNTPIKINKLYINDKQVDIDKELKNKTFLA